MQITKIVPKPAPADFVIRMDYAEMVALRKTLARFISLGYVFPGSVRDLYDALATTADLPAVEED